MSSQLSALHLIGAAAALAWALCVHADPLPQHLRRPGRRPADLVVLASVPAVVGRRTQAPLDLPAARHGHRCFAPDAWVFPAGTRLWKEFSLGRPVETRFIERLADGTWQYATYIWNEEGTDATLAPADGIAALATRDGYSIPSQSDCRAVMRAPRFRCWASARCSCPPTAIRSRRTRMRARTSISTLSSRADSSEI
jgi:hypothetical protein